MSFPGVPTSMTLIPWRTLNAQNRGFSEFFAILGYGVHWASEFSLKLLEINKTTCVWNYTDAVARLMSISSDFLFFFLPVKDTRQVVHTRASVTKQHNLVICAICFLLQPYFTAVQNTAPHLTPTYIFLLAVIRRKYLFQSWCDMKNHKADKKISWCDIKNHKPDKNNQGCENKCHILL